MGTSGYDVVMKTTKFLCPKTTVKLNNIVQTTSHRSAVLGPADLCLASTMLGQNRPRDVPCSSSGPAFNFFPLQPSESATQLSVITRASHHFLSLTPYNHERQDSSELFHRGRGCHQPPALHAPAGFLYLPFSGLLF